MVNQVVRAEKLDPFVETIFRWRQGDPSHCLLRLYGDEQNESAVVVASKLYCKNPDQNHISEDFEQLALAIYRRYLERLSSMQTVEWIAHYGLFSVVYSFENLHTPERFSRISLPWPIPKQLNQGDGKWWVLRPNEVEELKSQITLEPVDNILSRLTSD